MANRPAPFKQADLTRALKGFLAAGLDVCEAWIENDGTIKIKTQNSTNSGSRAPDPDELLK